MSDIYSLLIHDHRQVDALFHQLADHSSPALRGELCSRLAQELRLHNEAEESTFYAELEQQALVRDQIVDARNDHRRATELLEKLKALNPYDERWEELFMALRNSVESHVAEEESKVFSKARQLLNEQAAESLGQRFQEAKQKLAQ